MREKIAEFVRVQRTIQKLSQTDLGNRAGVTIRTIQKIEAGIKLKDGTVDSIIKALGYKIVWSIDFEELKKKKNE